MSTSSAGRTVRRRAAAALAAAGVMVLASGLVLMNASSASAGGDKKVHKSYVCKYVSKPGEAERLQTGNNPIWVDNHSLTGSPDLTFVGEAFSDAQGRSVVIVANTGKLDPEPSVQDCPQVQTPSPSPSVSPSQASQPSDVCPNLAGVQTSVPPGYELVDGECAQIQGTETAKPKPSHHPATPTPTVLGTQAVAPTAVEAGLAGTPSDPGSTSGAAIGTGLVAGGLLLLVAGGWLALGRSRRGAHQI